MEQLIVHEFSNNLFTVLYLDKGISMAPYSDKKYIDLLVLKEYDIETQHTKFYMYPINKNYEYYKKIITFELENEYYIKQYDEIVEFLDVTIFDKNKYLIDNFKINTLKMHQNKKYLLFTISDRYYYNLRVINFFKRIFIDCTYIIIKMNLDDEKCYYLFCNNKSKNKIENLYFDILDSELSGFIIDDEQDFLKIFNI